nr:ATPase inhibitor, mitochondrial isoform X2 [Pogona vitticeps]
MPAFPVMTSEVALVQLRSPPPHASKDGAAMAAFDSDKSGAIRDAGGAFGKKEAAEEERYFRKLQKEQLTQLRKHHEEEIHHHKEEIERLQKEIERHKSKIKKLHDDD